MNKRLLYILFIFPAAVIGILSYIYLDQNKPSVSNQSVSEKTAINKTDPDSCTDKKNGLIILVDFPDIEKKIEKETVEDRFFNELNGYVQEMSYGKSCITGDVTEKWYTMPNPVSYYKISPRNLEVDKSDLKNFVVDAVNAADQDVDFSKYSFVALYMNAKRTEFGMIGLAAYPGMLGIDTTDIIKTKSGQTINGGIAVFSYEAHSGTLFHDIAHILGGVENGKRMVPCLYDHDLQAQPGPLRKVYLEAIINMGFWDPMSCHYYKWNLPPPGISSWTKIRLGWIDPEKIATVNSGENREIVLGPLEDGESETLVIKIPVSENNYYLIENRQPIGYDKNLPGSGILIIYADDTVAECRHGNAPVKLINADPDTKYLEGAAFDIGGEENFVDEQNGIEINLIEKIGKSYKIQIIH